MQAARSWAIGIVLVSVAAGLGSPTALAQTPSQLLTSFQPRFKGVEYDLSDVAAKAQDPAVKAAVEACKVEKVSNAKENGWVLRDGQGKLLRKFVDTNFKKTQRSGEEQATSHLDQWSYYQDGFEVYREVDLDEDGALDEVRWLNNGGTRIADVKGGKIIGWKRISAEEASKVVVQALTASPVDVELLETVIATAGELEALGLSAEAVSQATTSSEDRAAAVKALRAALTGWDGQTTWSRFDGTMPRTIPADGSNGLKADIILYENAVIFPTTPANGDPRSVIYLSAAEIVRLGDCWKFVSLPSAVDPKSTEPLVATGGSLRSAVFGKSESAPNSGIAADDPAVQGVLAKLTAHSGKMPAADAPLKTIAEWHLDRIEILRELIQHVKGPDEQLPFYKEVVNDLAAAYQTGLYPEGEKVFERLVEQGGKIGSYAAYRLILAGFELAGREPGANQLQLQLATIKKLKEFLEKNPGSDEEPEALYYVATALEFNGEEEEAKTYYTDLAEKHAAVPAGKTAAGALRRLSLEGQALKLAGPDAAGKTITADQFKGKTLLVHFWTAAADPERSELAELAKVYQRQKAKGLEILGVCLDADKAAAQEFLKENQITWPQILEEGGMDSRLSNEFGIITTPTMFLVDPTGKVTSRKLRKASEVETSIERAPVAGRSANGLNR